MTSPIFHPAVMHINRKTKSWISIDFCDEVTTLFIEVYCPLNAYSFSSKLDRMIGGYILSNRIKYLSFILMYNLIWRIYSEFGYGK